MKDFHQPLANAQAWQLSNPAVFPVIALQVRRVASWSTTFRAFQRWICYSSAFEVLSELVLKGTPLQAALELHCEASMPRLRAKSLLLTGFLETLLQKLIVDPAEGRKNAVEIKVLTPRDVTQRGAQLSLFFSCNVRYVCVSSFFLPISVCCQ